MADHAGEESGPADRGPSEREPSEHGPTERGPTERGPTEHGPTGRGPTEHGPTGRGHSEASIAAAIEEASRSLGVPGPAPGEPGGSPGRPGSEEGTGEGWARPIQVVTGLLLVAVVLAFALRGAGSRGQPAHLVEADLRWAVARVVEHVESERTLRGRIPEEPDLRILLGEALTYSVGDDGYRVTGRRDGVRVEYDGSVPLDEWSAQVLYPPGAAPP